MMKARKTKKESRRAGVEEQQPKLREAVCRFLQVTSSMFKSSDIKMPHQPIIADGSCAAATPVAVSGSDIESSSAWSAYRRKKKLHVGKTSIIQNLHSSFIAKEPGESTPTLPLKPIKNSVSIECIFSTMSFEEQKRSSGSALVSHESRAMDETGHWELHSYPSLDSDEIAATDTKTESLTPAPEKRKNKKIAAISNSTRSGSFFYVACFGNGGQIYEEAEEQRMPSPTKLAKLTTSVHVTDIVSEHPRDYSAFLKAYDELLSRSHQLKEKLEIKQQQSPTDAPLSDSKHSNSIGDASSTSLDQLFPALPDPSLWPQFPLALCTTPNSGMKIIGVRYSSSPSYLSEPWCSMVPNSIIRGTTGDKHMLFPTKNQLLPINSGLEPAGNSLVIDFETELFIGTFMLRIKDAFNVMADNNTGNQSSSKSSPGDYFGSMNRKYQAVIRGEFKASIPVIHTVTGQVFPTPVLNLPSTWVLKSTVSIISMFAPQLQANFDGGALDNIKGPSFISPLGSTPQVVMVQEPAANGSRSQQNNDFFHRRHGNQSMESSIEEPMDAKNTLVGQCHAHKNNAKQLESLPQALQRANARKKLFDKLYAKSDSSVLFTPGKIYTFEFLQHLVNFNTFTLDLALGGRLALCDTLNGQPLRTMAAHLKMTSEDSSTPKSSNSLKGDLQYLWSFDIWHQGLYKDYLLNIPRERSSSISPTLPIVAQHL